MYYLYDEKKQLKPLRLDAQGAIEIARFCNAILVSNRIEEVILISGYEKSAFFISSKNQYSVFRYCLLQAKYRTLNEFRIIIYAARKSWLYYLLKAASSLSFGYYQFLTLSKKEKK